jgi:hypothetical protein
MRATYAARARKRENCLFQAKGTTGSQMIHIQKVTYPQAVWLLLIGEGPKHKVELRSQPLHNGYTTRSEATLIADRFRQRPTCPGQR